MSFGASLTFMVALVQISLAMIPRDLFEGAGSIPTPRPTDIDSASQTFYSYIIVIFASLALLLMIWRIILGAQMYLRTLACLNNPSQRYFSSTSQSSANFKKHFLYAPIFQTRHNKEFQLSKAVNIGTIPSRLQLVLLILYLVTNVVFCVATIHWSQDHIVISTELRNRTGNLAMVNMVPLFVMAARNNPLIIWLGISFDTFNLLHRYFGRLVVIEVIIHTVAWIVSQVIDEGGWSAVANSFTSDYMIIFGLASFSAMIVTTIQGVSAIRHAFYETFKCLHIILVVLSVLGIWFHLRLDDLPQVKILIGVTAIWGLERFTRIARLFYRNVGCGGGKALVESLPGRTVRVTLDMARPWTFRPGQHAYIYMPSIGLWTSHPFSVIWSEEIDIPDEKKIVAGSEQGVLIVKRTKISFIIRARSGFTASLFKKAEAAPGGQLQTMCFAEGPYGGLHTMRSYGTAMLFAAGVGISHQLPYVRDLVSGYVNGDVATQRIVLIWVLQSPEHRDWVKPWMTEILAMEGRHILRIKIFISQPHAAKEVRIPSAIVQLFPGRPNIEKLLDLEIKHQVGAMVVSVCACGSMGDDVRKAVRSRQHMANIDYTEEAFSW